MLLFTVVGYERQFADRFVVSHKNKGGGQQLTHGLSFLVAFRIQRDGLPTTAGMSYVLGPREGSLKEPHELKMDKLATINADHVKKMDMKLKAHAPCGIPVSSRIIVFFKM